MKTKKILKLTFSSILTLFIAIMVLYFWASSPNYTKGHYSQLIENTFPKTVTGDSVYSIISYNIGYLSGMTNNLPVLKPKSLFDNNLNRVYAEFEKINADIICFQEIDYHSKRSYYVNQQEEIQKLGYNYVFQAVNWDLKYVPFPYFPIKYHFGEIFSGQSILSKYPLLDTERIVLNRVENTPFYIDAFYLERLAQVSKTIIDGKTVVLINVHLEAFDRETRTKHVNFIAKLYTTYKDDYPVLLVGDFNSDITFENASIHTILNLPDIKSAVSLNHKSFPSTNPINRLDYIFYNEKFIELKSAKIINSFEDASDHLPIMMEFTIR